MIMKACKTRSELSIQMTDTRTEENYFHADGMLRVKYQKAHTKYEKLRLL